MNIVNIFCNFIFVIILSFFFVWYIPIHRGNFATFVADVLASRVFYGVFNPVFCYGELIRL